MAYFLGRDVEVAITTEHDDAQHTGISADYGITSAIAVTTVFVFVDTLVLLALYAV